MSLRLLSAAFTELDHPDNAQSPSLVESFQRISTVIERQTQWSLSAIDEQDRVSIDRHFLCSTMLELPFTSGAVCLEHINGSFSESSECPVTSYIYTYECASWGYSLRHYLKQNPNTQYLLVSILDSNVLDLTFWEKNENWGKSGFGLCTLLIEVTNSDQAIEQVTASCAMTYNSTPEFATVIRRMMATRPDVVLALPFFPEDIRQIFTKLLGGFDQLPDLHDRWGHCFGSDPWLSIIAQGQQGKFNQTTNVMACSIALNGYFCMAEIEVDAATRFQLNEGVLAA